MIKNIIRTAIALVAATAFISCQDDVSEIGSSLTQGEVSIFVDSLPTDIPATTVYYDNFDSRTMTKLLGRLNVPEYGSLSCSFVSQMLSAQRMNIPDSITVNDIDSMRLVLSVPTGNLTGDSLAPQQLRVFRLDKNLPAGITANFDPTGYYSQSGLMGSASYTLSNISKGDSAMNASSYIRIPVKMPVEFAKEIFTKYRAGDPVFEWPATFNEYFPGIFVEQNFGNGCVANITRAEMFTYWHYQQRVSEKQPDDTYKYVLQTRRDSVCLLSSQPEVLSSNVIRYNVSDDIKARAQAGESIITTPGGYYVDIDFPAQKLLDEYHRNGAAVSMVSALKLELPANSIHNDHGISVAPYLLMVRKSERDEFFRNNRVPDGVTSFYAAYNSGTGSYQFNGMRQFFLKLLDEEQRGEEIGPDDVEFSLIPVNITTETSNGYNSSTVYVTRCAPYLDKPTMTRLHTNRAVICFTYSSQQIE